MAEPTSRLAEDTASIIAAAAAAGDATGKFNAVVAALGEIAQKYAGDYSKLLAASAALDVAAKAQAGELYKKYVTPFEQAALIPRQLVAELTGASVLGLGEISAASKRLRDQTYEDQQQMVGALVNVGGEGAEALTLPLASFYKDASALGKAFIEGALGDSRLYSAGMRALSETQSYETKKISAFTAKGLGLDAQQMRAIYQEEFSKTGQITGDFVEKFSATVLAAEKVTGLSNRALSEDMKRMITDVENFGNISKAQMASLSNTMHQLGIDINDVTAVAGKFASFDSATTAISNLSAVTGATLDTMELFYLANEDKEEFFRSLRQQLIDQGVSFENLSHQEQVYLSKQLGFSSVRQLQSLMNEDIALTSENMSEMIENAAEGSEFQGKNLEDALMKTGGFAKDTLEALKPEALSAALTAVQALSGGTDGFATSLVKVSTNIAKIATESMPAFSSAGKIFSTSISTSMNSAVDSIKDLNKFIDAVFSDEKGFKKLVDAIVLALKPFLPKSMPPIWQKVLDGLGLFRTGFVGILDSTATEATKKIEDLNKNVASGMQGSIETTVKSFAELREKSKAEIVEIDKIEKQLAADSQKLGSESGDLTKRFKDLTGFRLDERAAKLQKEFGGGEDQILTDANVTKLVEALEKKDFAAGNEVVAEALATRAAEALARVTATAPAAPAVPTASAGTTATATVEAEAAEAAPARGASAAASGDMAIKVKIDFDMTEMKDIIKATMVEAITGGITLVLPSGGRTAGTYNFVLENQSK